MGRAFDIREARAQLSRLVAEAAAGKDVVITEAGMPMARLVPATATAQPKRLSRLRGRIKVPDDFNAPLGVGVLQLFGGT